MPCGWQSLADQVRYGRLQGLEGGLGEALNNRPSLLPLLIRFGPLCRWAGLHKAGDDIANLEAVWKVAGDLGVARRWGGRRDR
jgi:hypothetical protein